MRSLFYLPGLTADLPEAMVDLEFVAAIDKESCPLTGVPWDFVFASLTDDGRMALQEQIARFFGHARDLGQNVSA